MEIESSYTCRTKMAKLQHMWKWLTLLFLVVSIGLLIALIVVLTRDDHKDDISVCNSGMDDISVCNSGMDGSITSRSSISLSQGLFDDLSSLEINNIRDYMFKVKSLDLKPNQELKINSNRLALIQFYPPAKDDALAHLDQNKPKPARQALVVVFLGAYKPPVVEEYIVGPVSAPSKHEVRRVPGREYPIHFNARPFSSQEGAVLDMLVFKDLAVKAHDLLNESYDGYTYGAKCGDRCLAVQFAAPMGYTSEIRENWYGFYRFELPLYVNPLNFEFYVNHSGSDPSNWRVEKILYNNQLFDSVEELMAAYGNGTLVMIFMPAPSDEQKKAFTYERRGTPQPAKPMRGPELYEPDGRRYSVRGRHVEYMNWAFDFRIDTSTGMQVYDVRFGGDRIAYEISLQEAIATYTGFYPVQMSNHFLDSNYLLGANCHDLLQGTDCPGTATFFDLVHLAYTDKPFALKNAVCVFELNTGIPLRRHYDNDFMQGYRFFGSMVNQALVLRTVTTVGNYDYTHDFIFYQSGAIEVKVSMSGYVFGSLYDQNVASYGYPIHDNNLTSTTHDHLLNYRVDLDVGGRENSYETIEIGIENVTDKWLPEKNRRIVKKVLKRSTKITEQEAAYKFDFDHPKYLNFYNDKSRNKMGVKKGYRIQHSGIMKQLYPEDWDMVPMISWSLYQLAVTKYKDSERKSTSLYNQNAPKDPHVDFRKYLSDDENIVNQDLVAWVTIGAMHIPHSEDIPTTTTTGSSASFLILPFNYFDEDPSMGSTNAVYIKPIDKKYTPSFNRFGTPAGPTCVPRNFNVSFDGRHSN